jgi:hypothetical protein
MHLRLLAPPLLAAAILLVASPARADTAETAPSAVATTPAAPLLARPDAASARAWLLAKFPPHAYVGDEWEFLLGADEILSDPELPDVRLFVYFASTRTASGTPAWVAWLGLDEESFVVLLEAVPLE